MRVLRDGNLVGGGGGCPLCLGEENTINIFLIA